MHSVIAILRSAKFWGVILLLPLVLVGCSKMFVDFDSAFISDDHVQRDTVQTGNITLSYLMSGDPNGQRVIFLHGTPGDAGGNWYEILKNVPSGYQFLAIDRPGFGMTIPRKEVVTLNAQAAVLEPLLTTRNGKGTILVGHSYGGPVVAAAAANYPDKVAGIVIAAGALDPNLEKVLFIQHVGNVPPFSWLLDKTLRNSNRELIALENELQILKPRLKNITAHVRIVHGTIDTLVPYANVPYMEHEITNAKSIKTTTLEGMNHFLQWRSQNELREAIFDITTAIESYKL